MRDSNIESLYDTAVRLIYSRGKFNEDFIKRAFQVDGVIASDLIKKMTENGAISEVDSDGNYTPSQNYIHSDYLLKREVEMDSRVINKKSKKKKSGHYSKALAVIAFLFFLLTCYFASREMITLMFILPSCLLCFWVVDKLKRGSWLLSFLVIITCAVSLIYVNSLTPIFGEKYAQRANNQRLIDAASKDRYTADGERIIATDNAINSVKSSLKDPDSAKFSSSNLGKSGAVCGWVNAKNSFGAYTGDSRYISIGGKSNIDDGSQAFSDSWSRLCN